ncbi:SUR7/PalI family-domain-containing protein [Amylostereum chailletii]|nr:SUR7/PalI family-domain-containing protein [Amylostereum chailletii]
MGLLRPATPGFIVTLTATILLAIVSFCVPWIKSVYFLKASLQVEGISGNITFGTLGYCTELSNGTTCSKPAVGYQLDINQLVGNNTSVDIPDVLVKWITYVLVLHIVALVFAAGSALFGLLAHIREFSMTCLSTCVSGFGAVVTLVAFIFDLAFFFTAKARINDVNGGHAEMGNAIWLTLAAWLLLFFSGCFYCVGRCCINRRPRDSLPKHQKDGSWQPVNNGNGYEDQMRLDAVKAEADRKARAKRGEVGLPAFQEYDPTQPLTAHREDEEYRDAAYTPQGHTGYAQATPGTRAVDDYYNPPAGGAAAAASYPPQPRRQATGGSAHTQQTSAYAHSTYVDPSAVVPLNAVPASNAYFDPVGQQRGATPAGGHQQYPTQASNQYGHEQYPSNVAYGQALTHDSTRAPSIPAPSSPHNTNSFYSQPSPPPQPQAPQRNYTLGGGGYGDNVVPSLHDEYQPPRSAVSSVLPYPGDNAATSSGPRGPRELVVQNVGEPQYDDSPPVYDEGLSRPVGAWGAKH